jgi:hypothetical protein
VSAVPLARGPANVAQRRQADAATLIHFIQFHLDRIVMKTLEKKPACRYETAEDLAMIIRQHLSSEASLAARADHGQFMKLTAE